MPSGDSDGTFEAATLYWLSHDFNLISRRKIEDDLFTGNFDYKIFVHDRGVVLRDSGR